MLQSLATSEPFCECCMYQSYYQLDLDPFRLTPDSRFAYPHQGFREVRDSMRLALEQWQGVLVVTGRPGTGKTTLSEDFQASCRLRGTPSAAVVASQFESGEFLWTVANALGVHPGSRDQEQLCSAVEAALQSRPETVLIVDEAQNLSAAALQEVLALSRLQRDSRPLLLIILMGQENLTDKLHAPSQSPLLQRVVREHRLGPLDLGETCAYIFHRLGRAGWVGNPSISAEALVLIQRCTLGLPRYICQLGSRLLTHGAVEGLSRLGARDVAAILVELKEEMLLPHTGGGSAESAMALQGVSELLASSDSQLEAVLDLTAQERAFLVDYSAPEPGANKPLSIVESQPVAEVLAPVEQSGKTLPASGVAPAPLLREQSKTAGAGDKRSYLGFGVVILAALAGAFYLAAGRSVGPANSTNPQPGEPPEIAGVPSAPAPVNTNAQAQTSEPEIVPVHEAGALEPGMPGPAALEPEILEPEVPEAEILEPEILDPAALEPEIREPEVAAAAVVAELAGPDEMAGEEQTGELADDAPDLVSSGGPTREAGVQPASRDVEEPLQDTPEPVGRENPETGGGVDEHAGKMPGSAEKESIAELVRLGNQALLKNYLTTPEKESAHHYYLAALELDPGNEAATLGLQTIAHRYGLMAVSMIEKERLPIARVFIQRGLTVIENYPELLALEGELDKLAAMDSQPATVSGEAGAAPRKGLIGLLKRFFTGSEAEPG